MESKTKRSTRKKKVEPHLNTYLQPPLRTGDDTSDVLRYWVALVENPLLYFKNPLQWTEKDIISINTGQAAIYHNFSDWVTAEEKVENELMRRQAVKDFDLERVECVSAEDLVDDRQTPIPKIHSDYLLEKRSLITQTVFWRITGVLIKGIKYSGSSASPVELPNRFAVERSLRKFGQQVNHITSSLNTKLEQVRLAYSELSFRYLHWVIAPPFIRAEELDDYKVNIYDLTQSNGIMSPDSKPRLVRIGDMYTLHPMFDISGWKDYLISVMGLATAANIFINFRFDAGRHFQYVYIYEHCFELLKLEEVSPISNEHNGACVSQYKLTVEQEDFDSGKGPLWIYEYEVPERGTPISVKASLIPNLKATNQQKSRGQKSSEQKSSGQKSSGQKSSGYIAKGKEEEDEEILVDIEEEVVVMSAISENLPQYHGLRVRLMFREDQSAWFFK